MRFGDQAPDGAVRVIGVLGGEPLDDLPIDRAAAESLGFKGELGKTLALLGPTGPLLLVGLGDELDLDGLRRAAGAAARAVPTDSMLATSLHTLDLEGALEATCAGLVAGSYRFDRYRSGDSPAEADLILVGQADETALERGRLLGEAVWRARDWVNLSAADTAPEDLAAEMSAVLEAAGFDVEIWDERRITAERLGGVMAVAAGSARSPRVLVGRFRPDGAPAHLALVGKGIVFDSGGLSLKTAELMETMKCDMAGAAAVVAGAAAVAALGTGVSISLFVPLCDNMPSGSSVRPGDVVTTRNGKTIEVLNTDAEGRLVLADALCLAQEESPDLIVDLATLTGAARIALGDHIAALFASSDDVAARLSSAAAHAGERMWHMPLPADYRKSIDSAVADMKNTGGRSGGSIMAALLLAEFVGEVPWAHVDLAAPAFLLEEGAHGPKGGTGFGVRTIVALASQLQSMATPSI